MGANLIKADLRKAALCALPLGGGRTTTTHMEQARMRYAAVEAADLSGALLDQADLSGANFSGARLIGASFRGAALDTAIGMDFGQEAA